MFRLERKAALSFVILTVLGLGFSAPPISPATAQTLYINSDYTFDRDITEPIVVNASNIVIDGNGFTLQGKGTQYGTGFYLDGKSNVTIKNVTVDRWSDGIHLVDSVGNNISGNTITNNENGIHLDGSVGNNISGNTITNNSGDGIGLVGSVGNNVSGNTITSNDDGIYLRDSDGNNVSGNTITNSTDYGIYLAWSSSSTFSGNTINNNNWAGIYLDDSDGNNVSGNTIANNTYSGIRLSGHGGNTVSCNTVTGNGEGIHLYLSDSNNVSGNTINNNTEVGISLIDHCSSNNVSGNTITNNNWCGIYLIESGGNTVSGNTIINNTKAGIYLFLSGGIDLAGYPVPGNNVSSNTVTGNGEGIYLEGSSSDNVSGNTINNNKYGIRLDWSSGNTVSGNNITGNNMYGIYLLEAVGNTVYHNNIIDNTVQASDNATQDNHWHHPILREGNYWSDYPGVDDGSGTGKHSITGDGIGDTNISWPEKGYDDYPFVFESGWTFRVVTFSASGLGMDCSGTVLTVDGATYGYNHLPKTFTWRVGSSHSFAWRSTASAASDRRYVWTKTTGLSTARSGSITVPDGDSLVQASYRPQYYLTVNSPYGSPTGQGWYNPGSTVSSSVTSSVSPGTGTRHVCTGWKGAGSAPASGTATTVTFTINTPSTVTWNWKTQHQLTIQLSPSGAGSTVPSVGEHWYDTGETVQISTSPTEDHMFGNWTGSGSGSYTGPDGTATVTINAPITETAYFLPEVTVTFSASGLTSQASGTILRVDGDTYDYNHLPKTFMWTAGSQHIFEWTSTAPAGSGVRFIWTGTTGLSTARSSSLAVPTEDGTVQASYGTEYHVTTTSDYGDPQPATGWYDAGATVTASITSPISARTRVRYVCTGWTGTGSAPPSGTDATVTFTVTTAANLTWNWKTECYLSVQSPYGNPTGEGWYEHGSEATASVEPAVPMEGLLGTLGARWVFSQWTGDITSTSPSATVLMNRPAYVQAVWAEDYSMVYLEAVTIASLIAVLLFLSRKEIWERIIAWLKSQFSS